MVEFEYYEDFECEDREDEIVQELLKLNFGIYGKQMKTTLDDISVEAEKKLNGTKVRVADLKILFEKEGKIDENRVSVVPSASNEILPSANGVDMENLTVIENTNSANDPQHALAGKKDDVGNKSLPEVKKNTSHAMSSSVGEPSKETTLDACLLSTPTTVCGSKKTTLDVPLPKLQDAQHGNTRGEHTPDTTSSTDTTTVHSGIKAIIDVSFSTTTEHHNKEVQTASDVEGEHEPVPVNLTKDSKVETLLVSDERDEMKHIDSNLENKFHSHLVGGHGVKNEFADTEIWNKYSPLKSSGSCQNTEDLHLSGNNAISTHVSIAGCLPECEEPRSRCENCIEIVDSLEQVSRAPSTSIFEDGTNVASKEGFRNKIENGEICLIDSSLKNEDMQQNGKCKPKKESKEKKKAKVHKKEKRSKDGKTEKTKSTKFHRRLASLFCCCFASQERNDEKNETEQSTTKDRSHCKDISQSNH